MNKLLLLLFVLVGEIRYVWGKDVNYYWTLTSTIDSTKSPDCMNTAAARRSMFLAENKFFGPTIEANEGDRIIVQITNNNPSVAASIHFHGIHQVGTPYSDGASFITQCALGPEQSQEYTFDAYPPGTHYWHDHASYNFADGLNGPIIIHPNTPPPYTYDEERVIYLQDWYIATGMQQYDGLNSWPFVWVGNPNSLLINGKGIAPQCTNVNNTASYNNSLVCLPSCLGDPVNLLSVINVTSGKTYRLRLINAGQLVMMNFAITGHNLTIVEVEGTVVDPVVVESLDIANGQRYDVLLTTYDSPQLSSYLIETTVRERNIVGINGQAILYYSDSGVNVTMPLFPPNHPVWNDTAFSIAQDNMIKTMNASMYPSYSALNATNVTRYVVVGTQNQIIVNGAPVKLRWAMNNISYDHGPNPLINQAVDAARLLGSWPADVTDTVDVPTTPPFVWNYTMMVNDTGGPGVALGNLNQSIMSFQKGQVVEIVFQNARAINSVAEFHPWHLHGHSFWIVGMGSGVYDEATDVDTYNLQNPVLRDTFVLQPYSWTAVRFITDNPGAWFFHCHILAHHVMGMGFTLLVSPDLVGAEPPNVQYCDQQGLEASNGTLGGGSDNSTGGGGSSGGGGSTGGGGSSDSNKNAFENRFMYSFVIVIVVLLSM